MNVTNLHDNDVTQKLLKFQQISTQSVEYTMIRYYNTMAVLYGSAFLILSQKQKSNMQKQN